MASDPLTPDDPSFAREYRRRGEDIERLVAAKAEAEAELLALRPVVERWDKVVVAHAKAWPHSDSPEAEAVRSGKPGPVGWCGRCILDYITATQRALSGQAPIREAPDQFSPTMATGGDIERYMMPPGVAVSPTPNPLSPLVHALSPEAHPLHGGFAPSRFCETCNAGDAAKADREPCHAGSDGDCIWPECPQLRDGEPDASGRHCPLDVEDPER